VTARAEIGCVPAGRRTRGRPTLVAVILAYLLLALWATWPLALHATDHLWSIDPERWPAVARLGSADHFLNLWILSWGCHALASHPLAFFDANIFHPLERSLATGEHMLGVLPLYAPVYAATGNPILAANVLLGLSFVLGGIGMYLLVLDLVGRRGAAFAAGMIFAFAPWRFAWLVHLQLVGVHLLPFIVFCLRRALETGSRGALAAFALVLTLQALTSYYLAYMCAVLCAGVPIWLGHRNPTARPAAMRVAAVVLAGLASASVVAALSTPYLDLAVQGVLPSGTSAHDGSRLSLASAHLREFLSWTSPQYAGLVPTALGLVGLRPWHGAVRMHLFLVWVLVAGLILSLGPVATGWTLPWAWLAGWVPGFSTLRVPERFVVLATLALAGLAGIGVARIQAWVERAAGAGRRKIAGPATAVVLLGMLALDWLSPRADLVLRPFPRPADASRVYGFLADHGAGGALLELPAGGVGFGGAEIQARSQYFSLLHWLPLLGGYNGYRPAFADLYRDLGGRLPDPAALGALVSVVDVSWVVVHTAGMSPQIRASWSRPPAGLAPAGRFGTDLLFRVRLSPLPNWRAHLRRPEPETHTFAGVPIAPVAPEGRRAQVTATAERTRVRAGGPLRLAVRVENPTDVRWPCFAVRQDGVVRLWLAWQTPTGTPAGTSSTARLLTDLGPGESSGLALALVAPQQPGSYRLDIDVGQGDPGAPEAWRGGGARLHIDVGGE
jgi:hypothetical protein